MHARTYIYCFLYTPLDKKKKKRKKKKTTLKNEEKDIVYNF